ncbi:MAG: FkbM family methyltransferase [Gemmatimonadales bacterium]
MATDSAAVPVAQAISGKWYDDEALVSALPRRYRAYALYSHLVGNEGSRKIPGGSFLLRALRTASAATGLPTAAHVRGIDGLVVVTDFADERVLDVIHEIRGENPEYRVLRGLLSKGDTFVDVGANFGTFTLLTSRMVGDSGKVIAIEPQPNLARGIAESARLSGSTNCEILQVACGNLPGTSDLLVPAQDTGRGGFFAGFSGRGHHAVLPVKVATLDGIMSETTSPGGLVIKLDVEGSEIEVLQGARKLIEARRPAIIVEINPWSARAAGRSPGHLLDCLKEFGYSTFATISSFPDTVSRSGIETDRQSNVVVLP